MKAHTVSLVTPGGQLLATGNPSCKEMLAPATPGSSTTLRTISLGYQFCLSGWPNNSPKLTGASSTAASSTGAAGGGGAGETSGGGGIIGSGTLPTWATVACPLPPKRSGMFSGTNVFEGTRAALP